MGKKENLSFGLEGKLKTETNRRRGRRDGGRLKESDKQKVRLEGIAKEE